MRLIHGTPITPKRHLEQLRGESFCVSYAYPEQLHDVGPLVPETGILLLDNGAFTTWKQGHEFDEQGFWDWANAAQDLYPNAVAVIPDKIAGTEAENLMLASRAIRGGLARYPERTMFVWHTADSMEQLKTAALLFNFIAIGSCEEHDIQKHWPEFYARARKASAFIDGVELATGRRPWVHVMRGLGKFHKFPRFDSADSSNVARNHCRTKGQPNHVRAMADRIKNQIDRALTPNQYSLLQREERP
jgi:hypothetical protein